MTGPDKYIYAHDWHHECYFYNPHLENGNASRRIGFYLDGDYYFFLYKDFKWGYLGHPWEQSISILGEELIYQFETNRPTIFGEIVRSSNR
ncbi:DUF2716 domain-containing protein [Brevibacillus formosus]|uniref:DUF2716 domain-containing protein n=1 Tax=Brevibacillus formosus TaxID=54913 RepID=A0ABQ0T7U2_9BACL|nr:DUF2716 domain-containing protein [Brevibacillus formosus]GED58214.1 hypothetical protein BFO01nite_23460 [Brevibacillus formosus]